jgi:tripeptidyl-peptidase-1
MGFKRWHINVGTSTSAPIVGSIITLINEQRIKAGKGPVGFVNPMLYVNSWALNDIVEGRKIWVRDKWL